MISGRPAGDTPAESPLGPKSRLTGRAGGGRLVVDDAEVGIFEVAILSTEDEVVEVAANATTDDDDDEDSGVDDDEVITVVLSQFSRRDANPLLLLSSS